MNSVVPANSEQSAAKEQGTAEHPPSEKNPQGKVVIFAPSPLLTITVEEQGGDPDIHLHAGGQGVWQARMARALGTNPTLCATFAGETGQVLRHLILDEGFDLIGVDRQGKGAAYIHDRREGQRRQIVETGGDPLSRHELDTLYGLTLQAGMQADVVLLSGPLGDRALEPDVYRRLAADLHVAPGRVAVDLSGARLDAALEGGVDIVKISHEELLFDKRITSTESEEIIAAMRQIQTSGADIVIVTRAEHPTLLLKGDDVIQVTAPKMEIVDSSGAGDSFIAATVAMLAQGEAIEQAVLLGAAAGALSVTRHGLGTGDPSAIRGLSEFVQLAAFDTTEPEATVQLSPEQLASFIKKG